VFALGRTFLPSCMCLSNAGAYPLRGKPEGVFIQVGSSLTHKYYTKVERLAKANTLAYLAELLITSVKNY
jgi:hypothetical protein